MYLDGREQAIGRCLVCRCQAGRTQAHKYHPVFDFRSVDLTGQDSVCRYMTKGRVLGGKADTQVPVIVDGDGMVAQDQVALSTWSLFQLCRLTVNGGQQCGQREVGVNGLPIANHQGQAAKPSVCICPAV